MKYFFIFCALFPAFLQAQTPYFKKAIVNDSLNLFASLVEPMEDGYIVVGMLFQQGLYAKKFDLNGKELWTKILDNHTEHIGGFHMNNVLVTTHDDNFLVAYTKARLDSTSYDISLVKFSPQGAVIWRKQYGEIMSNETVRTLLKTSDGGYLLAGVEYYFDVENDPANGSDFYVVKLDSLGNQLWQKIYDANNWSDIMTHAQETLDGGYIFMGYVREKPSSYFHDLTFFQISNQGELLWMKTFGFENYDEWGGYIKPLKDSTYLFCYAKADNVGVTSNHIITLGKMDNDRSILWQKDLLDLGYLNSLQTEINVDLDGGFFTGFDYGNSIDQIQVMFIKFDSTGDTLWTKDLNIFEPTDEVYIRELDPTPDGGYIATGFKYFPAPQQGFLVKMDSLGNTCWAMGCDSNTVTTTIDYPIQPSFSVPTLYPNPTKQNIQIHYPTRFPKQKFTMTLYNMQGQLVKEQMIDNQQIISVKDLSAGIYIYTLMGNKQEHMYRGKLVVQE